MFKLSRARSGPGRVIIPVIEDMHLNTLFQKLVKCLHFQKTCIMLPTSPHPLQHRGELANENLDILYGVRYHLKEIFWASSQWFEHLEALKTELRATCHCESV